MSIYDDLIDRLKKSDQPLNVEAAAKIRYLLSVIRDYNPDDALFDDEKVITSFKTTFSDTLKEI